jgi:hypothetical protein
MHAIKDDAERSLGKLLTMSMIPLRVTLQGDRRWIVVITQIEIEIDKKWDLDQQVVLIYIVDPDSDSDPDSGSDSDKPELHAIALGHG